jgi:putative salt-induced outer membrane protein
MRAFRLAVFGLTAMAVSSSILAAPIPQGVAAMITAASDSGDAVALKTTIDLAKKTNPDSTSEINALAADLAAAAEAKRIAKIESEGVFEGWTGQGQAGASVTTGNTEGRSTSVGLKFEKETLNWKHQLLANVDYTKQNGVTSQNRDFASYQGNYKINDRWYGLGIGSYERDQFAGFTRRFSESLGAGYNILKTPTNAWSVEAGPAYRQTHFITGESENRFGLRVATNYAWTISPGVTFTENLVYYAQSGDSTLTSTTALTAKVYGALSVQGSFLYNHEQQPPAGVVDKTDTTTRLSLVYSF